MKHRTTTQRHTPIVPKRLYLVAFILPLCALLLIGSISAAQASAPVTPAASARIATAPIDTGIDSESEQPAYTRRLAAAGWDFNPRCGRFNWYPIGHPCHTGHVVYPSGATVGG
jgi:hypothetical protein